MNDNEARIGSTVDGKYLLLEYLGCGGTGSVYRARHIELDNQVAIKIMHARFTADAEAVRRFQREAHLISELRHPNIVTVYAFGAAGGILYMVMEFLAGSSLRRRVVETGPLQPTDAIPLLLQICAGMKHAHEHHVLHRDLKPDNVIITVGNEGSAHAKVVDFGLARLVDGSEIQRLTQTGLVVGDPNYMSPEQAHGHQLDFRSDIYSFGCLMYETFSGHPPFVSDNSVVTLMKQVTMPPPAFAAARGLPAELEAIIMQAMAKSPDQRFASFEEMATTLEEFQSDNRRIVSGARGIARLGPTSGVGSDVSEQKYDFPRIIARGGEGSAEAGSGGAGGRGSGIVFGAGRRRLFPSHLIVVLALICGCGALLYFLWQEHSNTMSQPVEQLPSPEAEALRRTVAQLRAGKQHLSEAEALDLELRAQRVNDRTALAYAKAAIAESFYQQRRFEQSYIRARQALEMTALPPDLQSKMHYIAGRSAFFTDRNSDAEAYLQHVLDSGNASLPHDLVARDLVVAKLRVMRRQQADELAKTLDTTWVYRGGELNPNLLVEMLVLNSARQFDQSRALKNRILSAPLDIRSRAAVLAHYAFQTCDFGATDDARQALQELRKQSNHTDIQADKTFVDNKIAVCELFMEACAQHHEEVIASGPALLKRVTSEDGDPWDRQSCAEALARAYQAVGRYEEANKLRDLRRGI